MSEFQAITTLGTEDSENPYHLQRVAPSSKFGSKTKELIEKAKRSAKLNQRFDINEI